MANRQVTAHRRGGKPVKTHPRTTPDSSRPSAVPSADTSAAIMAASDAADVDASRPSLLAQETPSGSLPRSETATQNTVTPALGLLEEIDEASDGIDCSHCATRCESIECRFRIEVAVDRLRGLLGDLA